MKIKLHEKDEHPLHLREMRGSLIIATPDVPTEYRGGIANPDMRTSLDNIISMTPITFYLRPKKYLRLVQCVIEKFSKPQGYANNSTQEVLQYISDISLIFDFNAFRQVSSEQDEYYSEFITQFKKVYGQQPIISFNLDPISGIYKPGYPVTVT
jgi:hypothetical protein